MQHGSGDYAASGPAGHYYPHQYAPPGSNPYPAATDAPAPGAGAGAGGYASAPPYSVGGGYADQPPFSVGGGYSDQPPSAPAYSQPPPTQPQYGAGYPPYNTNPAPYPPEPYYTYTPPPTQPAAPPAAEPPPLPYDAPYYGGGYQPPAAGYDNEDYLNEGAYAYSGGGGGSEPYGARGTAPARSGSALFDDYGRSISVPSGREEQPWSSGGGGGGSGGGSFGAITRALPKADTHEDSSGGAQKFRVKLLPEGAGNPTDVLCQIGLDGIRMLDPNTSRTLRIYPLDSLTTWEVLDSTIFAFWAKTSVDIEAKRIRLKSSSYTSNTMLDTVTAATVQFKEIGEDARNKGPVDAGKPVVQSNEKKKGFDWMFAKPVDEVKDHWVPDEVAKKCHSCAVDFSPFNRRHHCRNCGEIFCDKCSQGRIALTAEDNAPLVRVCDRCMAEVTQRLSMAKEAASRSATVQSHEDLARKLKEEMERNRKSSGPASGGGASGTRMREVACPTCMATSILQRFLDADQWAEEDTMVGRLGMVMHAAFLFAGFQPYGAQPPSGYLLKQESPPVNKKVREKTVSLCRWYTARELPAQRCNGNGGAEAAVLMLSARGSDIALLAFLVTADGDVRKLYREHLDLATVAPLLSAGAMADTEPRGSRICGELSDAVCWPLLVDLCHRNGVRLRSSMFSPDGVTGLLSMPDDIMVVILGKLTDGEDLARVACTCRELKELVEGRDAGAQLWKPLYEALDARRRRCWFFPEDEARAALLLRLRLRSMSWKQKYVMARPRPWDRICRPLFLCDYFPAFSGKISWPPLFSWIADPPEPETVATRGEEYMYTTGGHRSKREGKYCKKRKGHGAGVIHSPSSRNRWKHR